MSEEVKNSNDGSSNDDNLSRGEFLLSMYEQLWLSIQRSESGMWSFIGAFAAIAVSVLAAYQNQVSRFIVAVFVIIIAAWGMNIAIISSRWRKRNIQQVTNIERQFLSDDDLGSILPRDYATKRNNYLQSSKLTYNRINFIGFLMAFLIVFASSFSSWANNLTIFKQSLILLLSFLVSSMTLFNIKTSWKLIEDFIKKTSNDNSSGKDDTDTQLESNSQLSNEDRERPVLELTLIERMDYLSLSTIIMTLSVTVLAITQFNNHNLSMIELGILIGFWYIYIIIQDLVIYNTDGF